MKRFLFSCFLFLLFSSLFAEQRSEFREVGGKIYVDYSTTSRRNKAQFKIISDNVLKLEYEAEFDGTEYYDITTYEDIFERKNKKSEWVFVKTIVKNVRKEKPQRERYHSKREILTVPDGYEVQITKYSSIYSTSLVKDGCIIITDEIAEVIFSILRPRFYVRINIPKLSLSDEVDISNVPFLVRAVSEIDTTLDSLKKSVTTVSSYEDYAKKLLAFKDGSPSPYLISKAGSEFKSVRDSLIGNLSKELDPLQGKFPEFIIVGTVQDYIEGTDATTFQIWGTTLPSPQTTATSRHLGYQNKKCNIRVIISNATKNSDSIIWYGKGINIRGKVYYAGRETAKTDDGKSVPLYVYYEPMKSTSSLIPGFDSPDWKRLQTLKSQTDSIEQIYSQYAKLFS
ncbi:MAG: hypothetical protein LBC76_01310 [Treponema sp.]|jgi:hypothetical protein|nr:hypothetical protein [Treponema sp.]